MLGMVTTSDPGTSGIRDIALALGGGIREQSLIMIEGEPDTGKSVLAQHIAYGILNSKGSPVVYYSTKFNAKGLVSQMESMSLETRHDLATDRFRVFKMRAQTFPKEAEKYLKTIVNHIKELPERFKLVIVDSPSLFMSHVSPMLKVDFLQSCKELCVDNRSIILVVDTHVFEQKTLSRAYAMSDYYLRLKSQDVMLEAGQIDTRVIKMMEVIKLAGAECHGNKGVKFEIKPRVGIHLLPFVQVKI